MTWIKICGNTNPEDALAAVHAGADALGFVFYEKSPRKIDVEAAREIIVELPPQIEKVGIFVNEPAEKVLHAVERAGLTAVQLHGVETRRAEFIRTLQTGQAVKIYLVLQADEIDKFEANESNRAGVGAIFIDSGTAQLPGGTGKTFDWNAAGARIGALRKNSNVVVAGGLNSSNVKEAIHTLKPWGVDVASGVEATPGKKDPEKVRAFIEAVRSLETK